jgi:hypothetical protein
MPLVVFALAASVLLISAYLPLLAAGSRTEKFGCALVVVVLTVALPVSTLHNEFAVVHYIVAVLSLGAAYVLTRDPPTYLCASKLLLLTAHTIVFTFLVHEGLDNFPLERILPDSSSNGITSYLIILQVNYCIVRFVVTRRPCLVTPAFTLLIAIVGYGRGSILSSAAIVLVNSLVYLSRLRPLHALAILLLIGTAGPLFHQHYSDEVINYIEANTKIGSGLYDEHRKLQISEYLGRIDAVTLFIGADYSGTRIETDYNNNPHNSYIRAHHIFGLPYLVLIFLLPVLFVSRPLAVGQRTYPLLMVFIMLFRAFTEPILFPTMLDLFFFAACFLLRGQGRRGRVEYVRE